MSTVNGVRVSHAPIDKTCIDCGETYQVARNAAGQSKRCPSCREELHREIMRQRMHERKRGPNVRTYDRRQPRERCRRCGKTANRYPHYCSTRCYVLDFKLSYNPPKAGVRA